MKRSVLLAMLLAAGASAQTSQPARPWLDSVDAGYIEAQKNQRPVLVLVSDDRYGSPFDKPLADPKVSAKLANWVLVRLGPQDRDAWQALGVASAPTLRVLTPAGRVVARLDTVLPPEALAAFFDKAAEAAAPRDITGLDVPSLVKALASPDAAVREAATRQLLGHQKDAAPAVIETLAGDNATARIAAADLLEEWAAPLDGVDPWQRSTITPERLATLKAWAAKPVAPTTSPGSQPYDAAIVSEELDHLLAAATAADARAIRERLVRFGDAILPPVTQRLASARSAEARMRLTALRYRLAATDSFAAAWPGGFDRLAAADTFTRRAALDELAKLVKPDDSRLLLELFGDDDPVVREKALCLLRSVGGDSKALVKLLADPEPNVRAAVLKSLAADGEDSSEVTSSFDLPTAVAAPPTSLASELAKYVATEKDPDLLVHAIHVLKNMPETAAVESLKDLLANSEWRVRAEAAEAIREKLGNYRSNVPDATKAKLYAALIKCLDDEEGFVVAKAVAALAKSNLASATEPMIKTISRRPEMAQEILKVIASDESMAKLALPQLKPLIKDPKPEIRAGAIKAIVAGAPATAGAELKLALEDPDERVRLAGVLSVLEAMNAAWPHGGYITKHTLLNGDTREQVDVVKWIDDYRAGKGRPAWLADLGPTLETMARNEKPNLALPAAVALCGLGKEDPFLPQIHAAIKETDSRWIAVSALNWLPWEKRQPLFQELMAATPADDQPGVFRTFAQVPDPRGAEEVWNFAKSLQLQANQSLMDPIHDALQAMYFGEQYYNMSRVPGGAKKTAHDALEQYANTGTHTQRVMALSLLLTLDNEVASEIAGRLLADPNTDAALRSDVLQVRLIGVRSDQTAEPIAIEALGSPATRNVAIRYLAGGQEALHQLHGIYLPTSSNDYSGSEPIIVKPPNGLAVEPVLEAMKDTNEATAAYAGYLAAVLDHPEGLKPLEAQWRKEGAGEREWSRLMYRAITKLNDDSKTPVLEEIYRAYGKTDYRLREFYWTIRAMKGDNILKLRKKIRDEVGMDRLK